MFGGTHCSAWTTMVGVLLAAPLAAPCQSEAPIDSAAVARFFDQSANEIEAHRSAAAQLANVAQDAKEGPKRRSAWSEATALDPSNTGHWLALAQTELEMGYIDSARLALASARVSLDFLTGDDRKNALRDYALMVAWWDYEMGRFEKGLAWADRAINYGAGLRGYLVRGLCVAKFATTWDEMRIECSPFRPLDSGGNRRANYSWCLISYALEHDFPPFRRDEAGWWLNRSLGHYQYDLFRWRDYGQWCEIHGARELATKYYERSMDSLPFREGAWISRTEFSAPTIQSPNAKMPVWINEDFGFITGSMLAYAALAYDRLRSTLPGAELQAEASRVDVATARVLARYKKSPWLHLWRAEALSELGRADEAMVEARTARARFRQHELGESEVDRVEAYVLVRAGKYAHAAAPAARATEALPMHADCWTTLGIVELRAGNNARATECFDKAIELDRRQPTALYERALLRLRGGDQTGALDDLKSAAELAPEDPSIRETLQQLLQIVDDPSAE